MIKVCIRERLDQSAVAESCERGHASQAGDWHAAGTEERRAHDLTVAAVLGLRFRFDQIALEPVEYGVVPKLGVLWLQYPVAFVRVIEQLRVDALSLQGREHLQAFRHRHPIIQLTTY